MKTSPIHLLLGVAALVAATSLPAETDPSVITIESLRLVRYVEPVFPASLTFESTREGYAEVVLLIAPDGHVTDNFAISYSHLAFAESVGRAVTKWVFEPGTEANKSDATRRVCLRFNFLREGLMIGMNATKEYLKSVSSSKGTGEEVTVCRLRDLDKIPDTVSFVVPTITDNMRRMLAKGNAIVYFYIDENGQVRVPAVLEASDPELASVALAAVAQWKFAPPSRKGHPTRVLAVQEFIFNPGSDVEVKGS